MTDHIVSRPGKRLAILSLAPDWGHVQPLLHIARSAHIDGYEVRFFVADRCSRLVEDAGFAGIGVSSPHSQVVHDLFRRLSRKNLFFLNFSAYSHANLFYSPEVYEIARRGLDAVRAGLDEFQPTLIVADYHLLEPVYRAIAGHYRAPLLIHNPSGTLAGAYRPFARAFGVSALPSFLQTIVERAGSLHQFLFRRYFYSRHFPAFRRSKALQARLMAETERSFGKLQPAPAARIAVGLGWIEKTLLGVDPAPDDPLTYLPPLPAPPKPLDDDVAAWLSQDPRPAVYLCFGSMLALPKAAYVDMVRALKQLDARVIWSISGDDAEYVRGEVDNDPNFLLRPFVAQPSLLQRPEIACFVTHAGSSSVQEALFGGVPMLCVPFYSDAPYISSLVVRLGAGLRVSKRQLAGPAFGKTLSRLMQEPAFKARSEEIAARLRRSAEAEELRRDFAALLRQLGIMP